MYATMAMETNQYAQRYLAAHLDLPANSRFRRWKDVDTDDVKVFLAVTVVMGLVVHEDLSDYWTTDDMLQTPFFPKVISRDRFLNILSFFHLSDNTQQVRRGEAGYDPLLKLGTITKDIIQLFGNCFLPGQDLSLDEGMIPFRGRIHFKVYSPDKPDKYGIKSYEVCDALTGYCCQYRLYTGKNDDPVSVHGKTYDLVMSMMTNYLGKGHCLYIDNYYTSPTLFRTLRENGTCATGTARNRKGVPEELKTLKLKKGDMKLYHSDNLLAMKYHDRKQLLMLSTAHTSRPVRTGKRDAQGVPIQKPEIIHEYNKSMGAVDRSDQMVAYSSFKRRTLKWWKKAFFHIFSLTILNAYILHTKVQREAGRRPLLQRKFRVQFAKELISTVSALPTDKSQKGRPSNTGLDQNLHRLTGRHFPAKIPVTGKKARPSKACAVCMRAEREVLGSLNLNPGKRPGRESTYQCTDCGVALCISPCFMLYHTYKDFIAAYKRQRED